MSARGAGGGLREGAGRKRPRPADDSGNASNRSKGRGGSQSGSRSGDVAKKRRTEGSNGGQAGGRGGGAGRGRGKLDEEIDFDLPTDDEDDGGGSSSDEEVAERQESADAARLRLAKQYLSALGSGEGGAGGAGGSDSEEDEGLVTGRRRDTDAISARLAEDAAGAAGSLFRPVGLALAMAAGKDLRASGGKVEEDEEGADKDKPARTAVYLFSPQAVAFKRGHDLPITCLAAIPDGTLAYTGSKDCTLQRWSVAVSASAPSAAAASDGAAATASSGSASASSGSSGSSSKGGTECTATFGHVRIARDASYSGRRRTKADVAWQTATATHAGLGKAKGVKSVQGVGYGGGRLGPMAADGGADGGAAATAGTEGAVKIIRSGDTATIIAPYPTKGGPGGGARGANAAAVAKLRGVATYDIAGHHAEVLAIAVSSDGAYVASAGKDKIVRVWEGAGTAARNVDNFVGHKDTVLGLSFRPGTHTLYSCSADRSVKIWSCDEMAHQDSLFGHQADAVALDAGTAVRGPLSAAYTSGASIPGAGAGGAGGAAATTVTTVMETGPLGKERLLTVGRDRTARLWKVPEETQLVFRTAAGPPPLPGSEGYKPLAPHEAAAGSELSLEAVRMWSEHWFVTGAQDGSLALWHAQRKRPVVTLRYAHGTGLTLPLPQYSAMTSATAAALAADDSSAALKPGALASDADGAGPSPALLQQIASVTGCRADALSAGYCNWITALALLPNSDLFASGSGDGYIRLWRISIGSRTDAELASSIRRAAAAATARDGGALPAVTVPALPRASALQFRSVEQVAAIPIKGIITGLCFSRDGRYLLASVSQEHRLGRWWRYADARNGLAVIPLPAMMRTDAKQARYSTLAALLVRSRSRQQHQSSP